MQFASAERKVTLSVREFAEFRSGVPLNRLHKEGLWRAQLGTAWHNTLQEQTEQQEDSASFEVTLQGQWIHRGWTFQIQGRIDQIIERPDHFIFREVKTTSLPLPLQEDDLQKQYPHYFNQLATYLALASLEPTYENKKSTGELLFVDITDGIHQAIPLGAEYKSLFERQLDAFVPFLEDCWQSKMRLQALEYKPAFEVPRPGQTEALDELTRASNQFKHILFEAPTGFGKTGTVLQFSLDGLKNGRYQRVIYLTGKSTGQIQAAHQLKSMLMEKNALHYFQLRNKREHANQCNLHECDAYLSCIDSLENNRLDAPLRADEIFSKGTLTLEDIGMLSARTHVCPYELSRASLPYAEVWLCDYNYIFSPDNQGILFNQPGFAPHQTLLIIDEAHNLPSRVNDIYSAFHADKEAEAIQSELSQQSLPPKFNIAWSHWIDFLQSLKPSERLDLNFTYELTEQVTHLTQTFNQTPIDYEQLSSFASDKLHSLYHLKSILENESIETLIWSPQRGQLRISCLDASPEIERALEPFTTTVLMSATLSPSDLFLQKFGLPRQGTPIIQAPAPWRNEAYHMAIDTRVDTRLKARPNHYATTAQTISQLSAHTAAPIVVFFPSYRYAETIQTYLQAENNYLNVSMQPRSIDLNGQLRFVEESLLTAHVLFFVLGSSFSESIDHLGGKIEYAIVVGPALPEVNPIQKAHLASHEHLGQAEAFQRTYQLPAMQKINQALGRLVRAPGQKAKVLLHCRRFSDLSYQSLLNPEYQNATVISDTATLQDWLNK